MNSILCKTILLYILNFLITEEINLKCATNGVYDFDNKTDIKILDHILKSISEKT